MARAFVALAAVLIALIAVPQTVTGSGKDCGHGPEVKPGSGDPCCGHFTNCVQLPPIPTVTVPTVPTVTVPPIPTVPDPIPTTPTVSVPTIPTVTDLLPGEEKPPHKKQHPPKQTHDRGQTPSHGPPEDGGEVEAPSDEGYDSTVLEGIFLGGLSLSLGSLGLIAARLFIGI